MSDREHAQDRGRREPAAGVEEGYLYRFAGIRERDGAIPLWLKLVVAGLLFWSLYYSIVYWSGS